MDSRENDGFPKTVKVGSVSVKIYRVSNKRRISFTVAYSSNGKRKLKMFADLADALKDAKVTATSLDKGEFDVLELRNKDKARYVHAMQVLEPTGVSLELAAQEYAAAVKVLGGLASVLEAVRDYVKRTSNQLPSMLVPNAVKAMIDAKELERPSKTHLKGLRYCLGKLTKAFTGQVQDLTTPVVADFLRNMKGAARSKNNARQTIGAFFKYCRERGWLPKDHDGISLIPKFKEVSGRIQVFTPWEMSTLLKYAREEMVPFLAIGAFAGLRSAEIGRLDWQEVHLADRFIEVTAGNAKTASRRVVPISENLAKWLEPHAKPAGRVMPFDNQSKQIDWLVADVNEGLREENGEIGKAESRNGETRSKSEAPTVKWKRNALRHSYISYRVAEIQNVSQVALEAGNSPAMIFKHYRELVRPTEAKKWFAIREDVGVQPPMNTAPMPVASAPSSEGEGIREAQAA